MTRTACEPETNKECTGSRQEHTRWRGVSRGSVSSGVVVVPYVPSSVACGRVMRESGMILIILSPTVQLVTKLKPNLLG